MARTRIQGHDCMVFDADGKSFAFGTNSTLSISTEMQDVSDKDTSKYGAQKPGRMTWNITTEHTLDVDEYMKFVDWQNSAERKKVWYGIRKGYEGGPEQNNTSYGMQTEVNNGVEGNRDIEPTSYALTGYVYCTDIQQTASNGDFANYSVTLTGDGLLSKAYFTAGK